MKRDGHETSIGGPGSQTGTGDPGVRPDSRTSNLYSERPAAARMNPGRAQIGDDGR